MHAPNLAFEKSKHLKTYVFRWCVLLLAAYLVSVLVRVEYRIYAQGQQSEKAIEGAKPKLIDYVKSTMFKPASFQFKSIQCNNHAALSPHFEMVMHYSANNIMGDAVPNYILVRADAQGNIVEVIRE